ncbi:hypothetical protein TNCV_3923521 [Trichonephila clavipes]|nr:hypothetical protein TNCV_3923521 [Trichonephila clavipes]
MLILIVFVPLSCLPSVVNEFTKSSYDLNSLLAPVSSGECSFALLWQVQAFRHRHEEERSRVEVVQLGTEHPPAAHASATNPKSSLAHCAQIKSTEKLSKIKELRIKYLHDLIDIETFDKDITDAAQLEALIKEKAQAELEFTVRMGEFKVLFPCPIQCCTHNNSNGPNSFRPKQKRPAESSILPATLILDKKQEKPNIVNKKSKKGSTSKAETNNKNPAKKTKQDSYQSRDDVIPTRNAFAGLTIDELEIVVTDKTTQVAHLSPKIKPIMLRYKKNYNLVLQELNKSSPKSINKLTGDYIKIQASNIEEHRAITALLKKKGRSFTSYSPRLTVPSKWLSRVSLLPL